MTAPNSKRPDFTKINGDVEAAGRFRGAIVERYRPVCCSATRQAALKLPIIKGDSVAGIGFDATCSPVGLDQVFRHVDRLRTQEPKKNERD